MPTIAHADPAPVPHRLGFFVLSHPTHARLWPAVMLLMVHRSTQATAVAALLNVTPSLGCFAWGKRTDVPQLPSQMSFFI